MAYEKVDAILDEWAKKHGLHLSKKYQGTEVRSVEIVNQKGQRYQIWVGVPDFNGVIGIHIWDYKRGGRRRDFHVSSSDLSEYLENALEIAKKWSLA